MSETPRTTAAFNRARKLPQHSRQISHLASEMAALELTLRNLLAVAEPMDGIESLRMACAEARAKLEGKS